MREDLLDLWNAPADARCITTNGSIKSNGRAVMGRGCAKQATLRYPFMQLKLGAAIRTYGNHVRVLFEPPTGPENWALVSFPVKHYWDEQANLALIERSAAELVALADDRGWREIVLPRPGCGNGKLSWTRQVRLVIRPLLDDRFLVVTQ